MTQALHTSSTGIAAGQSQINVIANNVANINTTAYKSANMTFETLYSNNLSYGRSATKDGGGINPKQIGYGTKVGGISRNFAPSSFVATGRAMDTMISGSGYYVVKDSIGGTFFTRDGIFSVDSIGNLVTQSGMKVSGAKTVYSNAGSDITVKIPKEMLAKVSGDPNVGEKTLAELNNASITQGVVAMSFRIPVAGVDENGDPIVNYEVKDVTLPVGDDTVIAANKTVNELLRDFNNALVAQGISANQFSFSLNPDQDGTIMYTAGNDITFEFVADGTTSNFLGETGLSNVKSVSYELNQIVKLLDMINYNDADAIILTDTAIDENGIVLASYSDGSVLTQYVDSSQTLQWKYTTNEGVVITGPDVYDTGSAIASSHFAIELATMVNEEGLISTHNNLWQWGPDVGDVYYGIAGEMSFGRLETGGYEESNVDIAHELSTMISAQRMIQMNSRVFSTASEVMQQLAYLGQ